jgi:TPR repeat protein
MDDSCIICNNSNIKLYICGRCNVNIYCSYNCQKIDWKNHKKSCFSCKNYKPQLNLANYYFDNKDYYTAIKWYFIASEKKSADAFYTLSNCYIFGYGVNRSIDKAREMENKGNNIKNCF